MPTVSPDRPAKGLISDAALASLKGRLPEWLQAVTGQPVEVSTDGSRFKAFCPACNHHKPKLDGVHRAGVWVATCRVCGQGGDLLKLAQSLYGCGFREAMGRAAEAVGIAPGTPPPPLARPRPKHREEESEAERKAKERAAWPAFRRGTASELRAVSELRGIPLDGILAADSWGHLRFGSWKGDPVWILRSHDGRCAEARRMDGKKFFDDDGPKALALDGSEKKHALLGEHLLGSRPDPVFLAEGGPDFLAACWLAYAATGIPGAPFWIPLGFLGSTCNFTPEQLAKLSGRVVRIFVHHDPRSLAGSDAANRWALDLYNAGCDPYLFEVACLEESLPDGKPVSDLNDALRAQTDLNYFAREATA
jgi:hypothetical protein